MNIKFSVNGYTYEVNPNDYAHDVTLNTFLREHLHLTATKYMCLEGGCGACVCMVRRRNPADGEEHSRAVNSCLTLLNTCADVEVVTNEGIGNTRDGYHPIQKRLAKLNGSQCGFCSPGFVMNMYALLESKRGRATMVEIENAFGGNLCRCTGYRPILDAMKSFAVDSTIVVPEGTHDIEDTYELLCPRTGQCFNRKSNSLVKRNPIRNQDGYQWYWPITMDELFGILNQIGNDEYILVAGNTAHGVYRRSRSIKHYIYMNYIPELQRYSMEADRIVLGANITLTDAMSIFLLAAQRPGFEYCQQLWEHFDLIANVPVRNNGSLAGNISIKKAHLEFYSDVFITFEGLNVQVVVIENSIIERQISLLDFLTDQTPKLVIKQFILKPYPKENHIFKSYKILARAQNVHAYVNAAFLIQLDPQTNVVNSARICFGGIRPEFTHAFDVESFLIGKNLYYADTILEVFNKLSFTLHPEDMLPEVSSEYRLKLACGLFYKFLLSTAPSELVKPNFRSGGSLLSRPLSSGSQIFETNKNNYPVTQAVMKLESVIQCSGEATYMNDILTTSNAVYCAFVTATKVGAIIEQIDLSVALKIEGVVAIYTAKDIPGMNTFNGSLLSPEPEEIFCSGKVKYYDQPLGVITAVSHDIAVYASNFVEVTYSNDTRNIFPTLEAVLDAQLSERIFGIKETQNQDVDEFDDLEFEDLTIDLKGQGILELGSQYHFTMEPQTTIAIPFEQGLKIYSATQWMDLSQAVIAQMLNLSINAVQLQVCRVGGGYGAKVTRGNQIACAASLAAYKLNRPARFVQTLESMMSCNGKRWACRSDYEFQAFPSGLIKSARNTFYEDAGCSLNENVVQFLTVPALKNVYNLNNNNFKVSGSAVVTDAPSNTWCRAPGTMEGIAMTEHMIEHVAFVCKLDPADVRLFNIRPGNKMLLLLPRFLQSTEYRSRRLEIDSFNSENRWRKRGIGLALMEFPLSTSIALAYPSTVAIYHTDGTVIISHGGIEMGQGINTKVAQVAAFVLGIPLELVKIESSNTVNGANAMLSANSMSSEMVCLAVRKACTQLNERLAKVRSTLPKNSTWQKIVQTAWERSINLISSDAFKTGEIPSYNIYGLSLTELEVDILTGNHIIRRVDILEDAGESLSPLIDVGQVEGAFIMGLGYFLLERLVYDRQTGQILTNRTWNYHPPGAKDIPIDFRIELLQKNPNPSGFMRSKATGEPALCLAVGAIFALQHALQSARQDAGLPRKWIRLGAPTTPETVVLNACSELSAFLLK